MRWPWRREKGAHIACVRELTKEQQTTLFAWERDVFSGEHLALDWESRMGRHFLAYENGELVGHVGLLMGNVSVGNAEFAISGLGGLITLPVVRGKGISKKLIHEFVRYSREDTKAEFVLLFCLDALEAYYQKWGFRKVWAPVTINQPAGPVRCPLNTYYLPLRETDWADGPVTVSSLPW